FGTDNGLIDRNIRYGQGFRRPSKKTMRLHRAAKGLKLFGAKEIRAMVDGAMIAGANRPELVKAGDPLRAMILFGINCGFGNADCGTLRVSAVDLESGWINYPRPKTGIARRCPLWPETVEAIRESLARRPNPKDPAHIGLVFVTKFGGSWAK